MDILKSMAVAFSTYSRIPMPQFEWEEKNMRYSMCFFPLIGAVTGGILLLLDFLLGKIGAGSMLRAAVCTVLPILVTGGIHLDGYMDTTDALRSFRGKEERLRILKDPHIGAFAVIRLAVLLIMTFGLYTEADHSVLCLQAFSFVISRCLSGLAVLTFPKAKKDGMLYTVSDAAKKAEKKVCRILKAELLTASVGMALAGFFSAAGESSGVGGMAGICAVVISLAAAAGLYAYYRRMASRKFGGTTGDLAGWFLTVCEFFMLFGIVIVRILTRKI